MSLLHLYKRQLIPAMFTRADIMAGAQTGTGKTAGFTLPRSSPRFC